MLCLTCVFTLQRTDSYALSNLCFHVAANRLDVIGDSIVCSDNRSLPKALECDFKWDCLDGSDEQNCGK
jgi:hypothetical protein